MDQLDGGAIDNCEGAVDLTSDEEVLFQPLFKYNLPFLMKSRLFSSVPEPNSMFLGLLDPSSLNKPKNKEKP
jgi:hypothetical protein